MDNKIGKKGYKLFDFDKDMEILLFTPPYCVNKH